MGRTVPTWRVRLDRLTLEWEAFRSGLRGDQRRAFDHLLRSMRHQAGASALLVSPDPFEPAALAMLVELQTEVTRLGDRLRALEWLADGGETRPDQAPARALTPVPSPPDATALADPEGGLTRG